MIKGFIYNPGLYLKRTNCCELHDSREKNTSITTENMKWRNVRRGRNKQWTVSVLAFFASSISHATTSNAKRKRDFKKTHRETTLTCWAHGKQQETKSCINTCTVKLASQLFSYCGKLDHVQKS